MSLSAYLYRHVSVVSLKRNPILSQPRLINAPKEVAQRASASRIIDISDPDSIVERTEAYKKRREKKLQEKRDEQDYNEIKDCTFAPELNTHVPNSAKGPVVVRGLGRFLELKELSKRLEEEKQRRANKAFKTSQRKQYRGYVTVPKPFRLSKG